MKNCNTSGFDFVLYAMLISFILAKDLTPSEQNLLGNFLMTIGQNLETISAYSSFFEEGTNGKCNVPNSNSATTNEISSSNDNNNDCDLNNLSNIILGR